MLKEPQPTLDQLKVVYSQGGNGAQEPLTAQECCEIVQSFEYQHALSQHDTRFIH